MAGLSRAVLAFVSLTALLATNVQADHPYPLVHEVLDAVPTPREAVNSLSSSITETEDHVRVATADERIEVTNSTLTGWGTFYYANECEGTPCYANHESWALPTSVVANARWIEHTPCGGPVEADELKVGFRTLEEGEVADAFINSVPLFSGNLHHSWLTLDGEPLPEPPEGTYFASVTAYYNTWYYPAHSVDRGNWLTWLAPPVTDADVGTVQRTLHIAIDDVDTVTWDTPDGPVTHPVGARWTGSGLVDVVVERLEQPC